LSLAHLIALRRLNREKAMALVEELEEAEWTLRPLRDGLQKLLDEDTVE